MDPVAGHAHRDGLGGPGFFEQLSPHVINGRSWQPHAATFPSPGQSAKLLDDAGPQSSSYSPDPLVDDRQWQPWHELAPTPAISYAPPLRWDACLIPDNQSFSYYSQLGDILSGAQPLTALNLSLISSSSKDLALVNPTDDRQAWQRPQSIEARGGGGETPSGRPSRAGARRAATRHAHTHSAEGRTVQGAVEPRGNPGHTIDGGEEDKEDDEEEVVETPLERLRNRKAARRSREKSKRYQTEMVARERDLFSQRRNLRASVDALKEEVYQLRSEVLRHGDCDCELIQQYIVKAARKVSGSVPEPPSGYSIPEQPPANWPPP